MWEKYGEVKTERKDRERQNSSLERKGYDGKFMNFGVVCAITMWNGINYSKTSPLISGHHNHPPAQHKARVRTYPKPKNKVQCNQQEIQQQVQHIRRNTASSSTHQRNTASSSSHLSS